MPYTVPMQMRKFAATALAGAFLALSAPSNGQDSAASEALFNKGVSEMEAGRYEAACPALLESNRLDPRAGTMFALAECEAKWGRIASAVAHYSDYVGLVSHMAGAEQKRHRDRARMADQQIAKLRPQVPQLTLVFPEGAPKGTVVKRDGVPLSEVSLGTALPVDPGDHLLTTQVPGGPEHEQKLSIAVGEAKRIVLELEMPKPTADPVAPAPMARQEPARADAPTSNGRTWAYVAGGIGIAGIMAGSVTGLMSMSKKKTVDDNCVGPACNQQGLDASEDGKTLGTISTVGFGVGLAGLATGVVLLLATPRPKAQESTARVVRPMVSASASTASIGLHGAW